MFSATIAIFYERDLHKLIEEVNLFTSEEDLWKVQGAVKNSAGNLVLHLIGGLNYLIGAKLGQTGYVRNRDLEFNQKGVPREELVKQLDELIQMIGRTLNSLSKEGWEAEYPIMFDDRQTSVSYVVTQLLLHLNYHLGQVNYLRRMLQ